MNMRDRFLSTDLFNFEETDLKWHKNPVFKLKSYENDALESSFIEETEIYLGLTKKPLIFLNDLAIKDSTIKPDYLLFASRHASESGKPAFLIHTTGNWSDDNSFGGTPFTLSKSSALLQKAGFLSLQELSIQYNLPGIKTCDMEVTHHGPTSLEKPLIFMELGSNPDQWKDENAARLVCEAIINAIYKFLEYSKIKDNEISLGFGGSHYATKFKKIVLNNKVALSFMCPKYYIQNLNKGLIHQMISNTEETINSFIIDWKGTNSEDKKHLIPILEEFNLPIKKGKDF